MHITTVLEQLGYPPNEVKVYLAALNLGESSVVDLAKKTGMPRTTVQSLVEDMHKKGLLNSYLKRSHKLWVAENPEKLMISQKEREAALKAVLPDLMAMRFELGGKPSIKMHTGTEQIKHIMDDIIDSKHHLLAIVDWEDWIKLFGEDYIKDFIKKRAAHFLKIRLLIPKTSGAQSLKIHDAEELRNTRFLPAHVEIKNTNYIYGNKVAIISLNKSQPFGIVLEDPDIAYTMTAMFEAMWNQSVA